MNTLRNIVGMVFLVIGAGPVALAAIILPVKTRRDITRKLVESWND